MGTEYKLAREPQPFSPFSLQAFQECPFKDNIFNNLNVMFILLGGSSITKLTDEYSDVDLLVIYDDPNFDLKSFKRLKNKKIGYGDEILVHALFIPYQGLILEKFNDNGPNIQRISTGLGLNDFQENEHLLYCDSRYKKQYSTFIANKEIKIQYGILKMIKELSRFCYMTHAHSKLLGTLCYAKSLLYKEPLDRDYLLAVKRELWKPLSQDYTIRLEKDKQSIRTFLENNSPTEEQLHALGLSAWKKTES